MNVDSVFACENAAVLKSRREGSARRASLVQLVVMWILISFAVASIWNAPPFVCKHNMNMVENGGKVQLDLITP
jgi:hypothetical protein